MEYGKKFLIIGNQNAITYKEIFPYIKDNKLWLGTTNNNGMYYLVPKGYEYADSYKFQKVIDGQQVCRVPSVCWFTNINNMRRNTPLDLYKKYSNEYPKYDNYNAIEVSKVSDIPMDYNGVMGVPITFLYKYCPDQFEIVGGYNYSRDYDGNTWNGKVNGKYVYKRLLIRFKRVGEYVAQLMKYGKKFLIIGNMNAITYKEIFPLIKNNQLWLGMNYVKEFMQPDGTIKSFGNINWYTNIENPKRNRPLDFYKKYYSNECEFPKYDNYDAIEVGRVSDIPMDYDGVMGVPITFLDKYCPDQFEIVGFSQGDMFFECGGVGASKKFVEDYYKNGGKGQISEGWKHITMYDRNGKPVAPYQRILIRFKHTDR